MTVTPLLITRAHSVREALATMDRSGRGVLLLVDGDGKLERTVTDGDLRRLLLKGCALDDSIATLDAIQSVVALASTPQRALVEAMNAHGTDVIPLVDSDERPVSIVHRRDLAQPILLSTPHMGQAERHYVDEAFESNWIAPLGPNVDAFEQEVAAYVGSGHAAAVSSGTAALHLAMRLLDVGPGDTVFVSSFTFIASVSPIVYQGATPVFIDCDRDSWNMCPVALARAFEAAQQRRQLPKAVVVVNLYGQSADYDAIVPICDAFGVPVVEDAAESLGATYRGTPSGRFGRLAAFSFNGNKIITTSGGGMLVSDDGDLIARARYLSTQAREPAPHYEHVEVGYNYRMSNILAGVGRGQMEVLNERVAARRAVFARYAAGLADVAGIGWMPEPDWSHGTRWLTCCTIDPDTFGTDATTLIRRLSDDMIEARPVWKPMHQQPVFAGHSYITAGNTSVSDALFATGVCLPSGSNMTDADVDRIVDAIRSAAAQ